MKKTLSLLLSLVLMLSLALPASAAETEYPTLEGGVTEIQKYGHVSGIRGGLRGRPRAHLCGQI